MKKDFFPPKMPSEHFIKDEENKNNILISEEEYINKYKREEIPNETLSPYILQKLVEEKQKENFIPETREDRSTQDSIKNSCKEITKTVGMLNFSSKQSKNIIEKKIDDKFKIFINNTWNLNDEENKKHNRNCSYLKDIGINNDIEKFANKKKNYFSQIIQLL